MIPLDVIRAEVGTIPANDASLARLVEGLVARFEHETRRLWARRVDHVAWLKPERYDRSLWLPLYPVEALEIEEGFSRSSLVPVASTEYDLDVDLGQVELIAGGPWSRVVKTTITGGYTETTVPADVLEGFILQVRFSLTRHSKDNIALSSQAFEKGTTSLLDADLHPTFRQLMKAKMRLVQS